MNFFARSLLLGFVGVVSFSGFGQAPAAPPAGPAQPAAPSTTKVEMPSDPVALLELAAKKNGLQNVAGPLHIKATYQLLDDKGSVKETGTIDEIRVSDRKYKLTYASPSFNQTDYSTDAGLFRVGDQDWPNPSIMAAHDSLYPNFPSSELIKDSKIELSDNKSGAFPLRCVNMGRPVIKGRVQSGPTFDDQAFCFDSVVPKLRSMDTFQGTRKIVYNNIASVGGAYIGQDVGFSQLGNPAVRVHLERLNALTSIDETIFTPPSGAEQIPRRLAFRTPMIAIVRNLPSQYPGIARAAHVQGTVVVQAVIGKDGKALDVRALSGPPMLTQAAMDTVRQQQFGPYLLYNDEPVEVETQIDVVYSLAAMPAL